MSVLAYLQPRRESLKMPDAEKHPNKCGITWHGPVLSGKLSVQEALASTTGLRPCVSVDKPPCH